MPLAIHWTIYAMDAKFWRPYTTLARRAGVGIYSVLSFSLQWFPISAWFPIFASYDTRGIKWGVYNCILNPYVE